MNGGGTGWPRAILFDLDGTLIDSAPDLRASVNILLAGLGRPQLTLPRVRSMIGAGIPKLVERALAATGEPAEGEEFGRLVMEMMEIYASHLTVFTTLMPGARDAIEAALESGALLGVVTNKPQRPTEAILDHFRLAGDMAVVIGGDAGPPKKPAPDILLAALDRLGIDPGQALMVGDSAADVAAARAAGISVSVVRNGYATMPADELGADLVIDDLRRLGEAVAILGGRHDPGAAA